MVDVDKNRLARRRSVFRGVARLAFVLLLGACVPGGDVSAAAGPDRAAQLAQSWARHVGAPERSLGPDNDMSLGETGIAYDPRSDLLHGRVWINMARTKDAPPERIATYRRMEAALNDPAIGGMFEHDNGQFVLDTERQGFFLVRAFPVAQTTPQGLERDMERLRKIAARWSAEWFKDVAMIMHGNEKPREHPVMLED